MTKSFNQSYGLKPCTIFHKEGDENKSSSRETSSKVYCACITVFEVAMSVESIDRDPHE